MSLMECRPIEFFGGPLDGAVEQISVPPQLLYAVSPLRRESSQRFWWKRLLTRLRYRASQPPEPSRRCAVYARRARQGRWVYRFVCSTLATETMLLEKSSYSVPYEVVSIEPAT